MAPVENSDSIDCSSPATDGQKGHGQGAPEEEEKGKSSGGLFDEDPSEGDDDDDDDDGDNDVNTQNSTQDDSTTHRAGKHTLQSNKSSSLGKSNKRQRHNHHHYHHHHKRDNYNAKGSDKLIIDWDRLADGHFGDIPLTRYIPFIERDNLLGWATHITQPTRVHMDGDDDDEQLFNPLAGLPNVPLPASMIFLLHEAAGEHLVADEKNKKHDSKNKPNIFECFDQSALVALGMVLEESITSSLLPLARAHVDRCRRLEEEEESKNVATTTAARESPTAFREWTLPPAEAVAKIQAYSGNVTDSDRRSSCSKGIETVLPSTRPPDRNALPDAGAAQEFSSLHMPLTEEEGQQDALDRWCKAHGLEADFVLSNMDIFGSLVSAKCQPKRL